MTIVTTSVYGLVGSEIAYRMETESFGAPYLVEEQFVEDPNQASKHTPSAAIRTKVFHFLHMDHASFGSTNSTRSACVYQALRLDGVFMMGSWTWYLNHHRDYRGARVLQKSTLRRQQGSITSSLPDTQQGRPVENASGCNI